MSDTVTADTLERATMSSDIRQNKQTATLSEFLGYGCTKNRFDWRKFPSRLNKKRIKEIDLISQPFIKALHIPYVSPKQGVFTKGKKGERRQDVEASPTCCVQLPPKPLQKQAHAPSRIALQTMLPILR